MTSFRYSANIKVGLLLIGFLFFTGILYYSQWIVERLREDNRKIVHMYAEIIAEAVESETDENLNFIFDKIITQIQFPIIQSDALGNPRSWKNIPDDWVEPSVIKRNQDFMDQQNSPIVLVYSAPGSDEKHILGYLHYGDSVLIRQLKWLPYLEIATICFIIFFGLAGFTYIRKTENNNIWTGMAKETAHQLGTPVSALIGWVERLKSHPEKSLEIIPEIEADVKRLEQVGNRFGKIGSKPELSPVKVYDLIQQVVDYLNRRLPSDNLKIVIENPISQELEVMANETLLSWAIENVIKNGLDSLQPKSGKVEVRLLPKSDGLRIHVIDNGSGILRKNWKHVFRPGFTTKKYGWGFGLSLSYRIIQELHHGTIRILKSVPNIGTTVEIHIP